MIIAVPKESHPAELRVALVPSDARELVGLGYQVHVEQGAGDSSGYPDADYAEAGAELVAERAQLLRAATIVVQVRGYGTNAEEGRSDLEHHAAHQVWIGCHDPLWRSDLVNEMAQTGATVMALEVIPRISRAQSMDVLSSMATIAGYKAVLLAATQLPKVFPLLMTAAGTVAAARVLVLGAGVAGLQAIATARRLGAVVEGYDIRPAAAEQIASLGAKAIELPIESEGAEDAGGYATAQGEDFNRRQQEFLSEIAQAQDVIVSTAAIPGAKSPVLLTREAVDGMRAGSIIVDLAAERGGNCELTRADEVVDHGGVTILGPTDLATSIPRHASQMFSSNVSTLLRHLTEDGELHFDRNDEITRDTTVARGGEVLHPRVRAALDLPELETASTPDDTAAAEAATEEAS